MISESQIRVRLPQRAARGARSRRRFCLVVIPLLVLLCASASSAYSVLTHEQIVDIVWASDVRPLLLKRFPALTEEQLREAHSHAYGGAVIQDLGYYPFGSQQFSNLVHYVRSGDFVRELLSQSQDANEYAFALGALAHYTSDITGHPIVNQAVALQYPKLRAKFGPSVRFAEGRSAHLKTEFGFDMVQVAKNRYASEDYHDFIGFRVSKPLLERTFPIIYGLELKDVLTHVDLAIGSYRFGVARAIPAMTKVALRLHEKDMVKETPSFAREKFLYRLSQSEYEKQWGKEYQKDGFRTRMLACLLRFVPKIGPFRALAFKSPTTQTQEMYFKSINATVDQYRLFLKQVGANSLELTNSDFDTGKGTQAAEYSLTDETYAKLLDELAGKKFRLTSSDLRDNLLHFYADLSLPLETKKDPPRWQGLLTALVQLKSITPAPIVAASPAN